MKIGFFAESSIPIHAHTLDERPLGGTETGIIRLAEILQLRGHQVTVYTSHKNPPPSSPRYLPARQILSGERYDLLVAVQDWRPVYHRLPAERVWFWTGDGPEQFSNFGLGDGRVAARIEKLLAVSSYHADALAQASGFPRAKAHVIGNGVHLPYFQGEEQRKRRSLIYTAAPYRGLALVPGMLLKLQGAFPDLEFHGYTGMKLYDRDRPFQGPHVALYERIAALMLKIPGVTLHGNVLQSELARGYMRSSIFFYPATVPETCCITAMEAIAAGCVPLTSSIGALPETVADCGVTVPGDPASAEFAEAFAAAAADLLRNDDRWQQLHRRCLDRRTALSWEQVATRFEALIHN